MRIWVAILFFFTAMLLLPHCEKKKPKPSYQLPPITQEGKNTFGCKIDGEVWVPYGPCRTRPGTCPEAVAVISKVMPNQSLPLELQLYVFRELKDNNTRFEIRMLDNANITTAGDISEKVIMYYSTRWDEYRNIAGLNSNFHFEITRLDTAQKIIAGTFKGTLYRSGRDSVQITEGRFDYQFNVCRCTK